MIENLVLKFLVVLSFISRAHLYPNYDECADKYIARDNVDPTLIFTRSGSLRGKCYSVVVNDPVGTKTSDVLSWLGVPYAQPPVNENRFKPPKPVESWRNIRDATQLANKCQGFYPDDPPLVPLVATTTSEDCLYLNIHVPALGYINSVVRNNSYALLPILVYIHGGGFIAGSSTDDIFDPSTLVAYSNVIVITINYRLGTFGFLAIENTEATGNAAFLDQNMALKWIHENAISFGGDPSRITISGESAGAFSVSFHLLYEKSWPYFRNAILQSGSATTKGFPMVTITESTRRTREVFGALGCDSTLSNEKLLSCAQNVSASKIVAASNEYNLKNLSDNKPFSMLITVLPFPFVRGGETFKEDGVTLFQQGKFKKANILLGFDKDEAGFFLALNRVFGQTNEEIVKNSFIEESQFRALITDFFNYYPTYPSKPPVDFFDKLYKLYLNDSFAKPAPQTGPPSHKYLDALIRIIGEMAFVCPVIDLASTFSNASQNVYLYSYEHRISTIPFPDVYGVAHSTELPVVFGEPLSKKKLPLISLNPFSSALSNYSVSEREFTKQIMTYWTNFVKYDNPNRLLSSKTPTWPTYRTAQCNNQSTTPEFIVLKADNISTSQDLSKYPCEFWRAT